MKHTVSFLWLLFMHNAKMIDKSKDQNEKALKLEPENLVSFTNESN